MVCSGVCREPKSIHHHHLGKCKRGLSKRWAWPERRQLGQKGPPRVNFCFAPVAVRCGGIGPDPPRKGPRPWKGPISPEKAQFSRKDFPLIFSENLGLKPPIVSPRLDFQNHQPESKKRKSSEWNSGSVPTPTVDMEKLEKLANHIYHSDSLACQGHFREEGCCGGGRYFDFPWRGRGGLEKKIVSLWFGFFEKSAYATDFLGDNIQGHCWGQWKRQNNLVGTFWTHVLRPTQGGLKWRKVAWSGLRVA